MNKLKDVPYYIDDNFVPLEIQNKLEFNILNDEQDFPWYYSSTTVHETYDGYNPKNHTTTEKEHFTHGFINDGELVTKKPPSFTFVSMIFLTSVHGSSKCSITPCIVTISKDSSNSL